MLAGTLWAERKIDQVMPLIRKAAATGRSQVIAAGVAQEFQRVFTGSKSGQRLYRHSRIKYHLKVQRAQRIEGPTAASKRKLR